MPRVSAAFFVTGGLLLLSGMILGEYMGAHENFTLSPLHAHINLLGWVSMSLFGVIGAVYPETTRGPVATMQFWIHNLALPVLLISLAARLKGHEALEPVLGLASTAIGLGVLLFAYQVIAALRGRPVPSVVAPSNPH